MYIDCFSLEMGLISLAFFEELDSNIYIYIYITCVGIYIYTYMWDKQTADPLVSHFVPDEKMVNFWT